MLAHPAGQHTPAGSPRGMWNHHEEIRQSGDSPTIANGMGLLCFPTSGGALEVRMLVILPREGHEHRGTDARNLPGSSKHGGTLWQLCT